MMPIGKQAETNRSVINVTIRDVLILDICTVEQHPQIVKIHCAQDITTRKRLRLKKLSGFESCLNLNNHAVQRRRLLRNGALNVMLFLEFYPEGPGHETPQVSKSIDI